MSPAASASKVSQLVVCAPVVCPPVAVYSGVLCAANTEQVFRNKELGACTYGCCVRGGLHAVERRWQDRTEKFRDTTRFIQIDQY